MPLADVVQLVTDLSDGLADSTAATVYVGDVIYLIGIDTDGTLVNIKTIDPGILTSTSTLPATAITTLALVYDRRHLSHMTEKSAIAWDTRYFVTLGDPIAWLDDNQPRHTVVLIPLPTQPPTAALPVDPTATDPGLNGLTCIYTEKRTDPHAEEELAVALEVMAREMSRDSDHTDHTMAQACRTLSGTLFRMLEIALADDIPAPTRGIEPGAEQR